GLDHDCDGSKDVPSCSPSANPCQLVECGTPCGPMVGECRAGMVTGCNFETNVTPGAFNPHFICAGFVGPQPESSNGKDRDCNGSIPLNEQDVDGDHYIACTGCNPSALAPGLLGCGDCAPSNGSIFPGAVEICNGMDDNCDVLIDNGACTGSLSCCPLQSACR